MSDKKRFINVELYKIHDIDSKILKQMKIDDGSGIEKWAIVDRFNNVVTPFFTNTPFILPLGVNYCLVIGKEANKENSQNRLYSVVGDYMSLNDAFYEEIPTTGEVLHVSRISNEKLCDREVLKVRTDLGEYLITPEFYSRISDIYSDIHYDSSFNSLIYEKNVELPNGESTVLTGPITIDGKVGDKAYDVNFHKIRDLSKKKCSYTYDVIDTYDIEKDLFAKAERTRKTKRTRIKQLINDNKA